MLGLLIDQALYKLRLSAEQYDKMTKQDVVDLYERYKKLCMLTKSKKESLVILIANKTKMVRISSYVKVIYI